MQPTGPDGIDFEQVKTWATVAGWALALAAAFVYFAGWIILMLTVGGTSAGNAFERSDVMAAGLHFVFWSGIAAYSGHFVVSSTSQMFSKWRRELSRPKNRKLPWGVSVLTIIVGAMIIVLPPLTLEHLCGGVTYSSRLRLMFFGSWLVYVALIYFMSLFISKSREMLSQRIMPSLGGMSVMALGSMLVVAVFPAYSAVVHTRVSAEWGGGAPRPALVELRSEHATALETIAGSAEYGVDDLQLIPLELHMSIGDRLYSSPVSIYSQVPHIRRGRTEIPSEAVGVIVNCRYRYLSSQARLRLMRNPSTREVSLRALELNEREASLVRSFSHRPPSVWVVGKYGAIFLGRPRSIIGEETWSTTISAASRWIPHNLLHTVQPDTVVVFSENSNLFMARYGGTRFYSVPTAQ